MGFLFFKKLFASLFVHGNTHGNTPVRTKLIKNVLYYKKNFFPFKFEVYFSDFFMIKYLNFFSKR